MIKDSLDQLEVDSSFHNTSELMVKDLLALVPFDWNDTVLDAGSGRNKVWFNNVPVKEKYECEILEGSDYFEWYLFVDWVIGNPPFSSNYKSSGKRFSMVGKWIEKASCISRKGMAFLVNYKNFNSLTPARLKLLKKRGFTLSHIHIVSDKRWYGRYFFIVFTKADNNFIGWEKESY